jgi:hypothetical protein
MKPFFEVLFLAIAIILFSFGQIPLAIFAGMITAIIWYSPTTVGKSVQQIIAEADGKVPEGTNAVYVEYNFVSEPNEHFTANLYHYSNGQLTEESILPKLAEYVSEHTNIEISADRLHITKIQVL